MDNKNNGHRFDGSQVAASHSTASTPRYARVALASIADPNLSPGEKVVYSALAAHRHNRANNPRYGQAWPSRAALASITGFNVDYISRACSKLVNLGYLERHQDGRGRGRSSTYTIPHMDAGSRPHDDSLKPDRTISFSASTPYVGKNDVTTRPEPTPEEPPSPPPAPVPSEAARGDVHQNPEKPQSQEPALAYPPVPPVLIPALLAALAGLGKGTKQTLMDELTGAMGTRTIINPVGYIRVLRRLRDAGTLHCEHADRVRLDRSRRETNERAYRQAVERTLQATLRPAANIPPPEVRKFHFDQMRAATRRI